MLYYRYYNSTDPMSQWGHAMFVDNPFASEGYGKNLFVVDGDDLQDVAKFLPLWGKMLEEDYNECRLPCELDERIEFAINNGVKNPFRDIIALFNPSDIVESAGAWDDSDCMDWFYARFVHDADNPPVGFSTADGAIVFNKDIIRFIGKKGDQAVDELYWTA